MQQIRKANFEFAQYNDEPEESLSRDEIADRLGEEMIESIEDQLLCP
jgi:hypothetical protein